FLPSEDLRHHGNLDYHETVMSQPTCFQIRQHGQHGVAQCFTGTPVAIPSQASNSISAEPNDWDVALPSPITTSVLELDLSLVQACAFHSQTGNLCDRDVVRRNVVNGEGLGGT